MVLIGSTIKSGAEITPNRSDTNLVEGGELGQGPRHLTLTAPDELAVALHGWLCRVNVCMNGWMLCNIVKRFEWPVVRKVLYKCSSPDHRSYCSTVHRSLQMMMKSLYCGGTEGVSLSYTDAMKVMIWALPCLLLGVFLPTVRHSWSIIWIFFVCISAASCGKLLSNESAEEVLWNPSVPKHDPGQQRQDLPDCQGQWTVT